MGKRCLLAKSLAVAFFFFSFSFLISTASAQQGRISIRGDVGVSAMVEKHVELNSRVKTIPGYRVQIASFSGMHSKTSAFNLRDKFMLDYSETQAYVIYDEPNFKVKVGDFRTRLEAYAFLQQINEFYKGYIIKDNIYPEPPALFEFAPDDGDTSEEEQ